MKERQVQLIQFLLYSSTPKSIQSLVDECSVSERTIKYDIANIRKELKVLDVRLHNKKGKGYYFSPKDKPKIIEHYSFVTPDPANEQVQDDIILSTLYFSNPIDFKNLAENLYYDESSVRRFLSEILTLESSVEINIINNKMLELKSSDIALRKLYVETLRNKLEVTTGSKLSFRLQKKVTAYEGQLELEWLDKIEQAVQNAVHNREIWISEESLEYLLLFIYVSHIKKNKYIKKTDENNHYDLDDDDLKGEYEFAEDILRELYWGQVEKNEIIYLVQIMVENNIFSKTHLDKETEEKLTQVLNQMMKSLDERAHFLSFDLKQLAYDLRPHLRQIIRKNRMNGVFAPNPLFYQIKQKYNAHYKIAQLIYSEFADAFSIDYSDNEASLIAIYLYKNTIQIEDKKYRAYLVCGTGRGFSKLIETRLSSIFPEIIILDTLSSFHLLKKQKIIKAELIITTVPLPEQSVPVVKISSFLGRKDIQLINQVLDYGVTSNSLLLNTADQKNHDVLMAKEHELNKESPISQQSATIFSNILLELYSFMVELPKEYKVNQEQLLGITIHLTMALPRYFDSEDGAGYEKEEIVEEVLRIEKDHPVLAKQMDSFLNIIENNIDKGIPYIERYALYQYILN